MPTETYAYNQVPGETYAYGLSGDDGGEWYGEAVEGVTVEYFSTLPYKPSHPQEFKPAERIHKPHDSERMCRMVSSVTGELCRAWRMKGSDICKGHARSKVSGGSDGDES